MPWIPFDQYMYEHSQIYCKDDRVAWIRDNEGIQCLGRPDEAEPAGHVCSACPWLAVGWVAAAGPGGTCGATGVPCKAGATCCRDLTIPASNPAECVAAPNCPEVYSQCCTAGAGCPRPFARECGH